MSDNNGTPYATCNHCGWHGKREQLLAREYGNYACPRCKSDETVTTADASREDYHRTRRAFEMETMQAFIIEMQRLSSGMQTVLDVMKKS